MLFPAFHHAIKTYIKFVLNVAQIKVWVLVEVRLGEWREGKLRVFAYVVRKQCKDICWTDVERLIWVEMKGRVWRERNRAGTGDRSWEADCDKYIIYWFDDARQIWRVKADFLIEELSEPHFMNRIWSFF